MVKIKRVYETSDKKDGYRVLVDRLWPRGIKKEKLPLDEWIKDLAPSTEVRKAFGHEEDHWKDFVSSYKKELSSPQCKEILKRLSGIASKKTLTLLYGAKDEEHNNAVVLKSLLEKKL